MPARKIRTDGIYSGLWKEKGESWPEVLIGQEEIGRYLRIHLETAGRWLRMGRLPACLDPNGRWMTTRRLIEYWILERRKKTLSFPKGQRPRGHGRGSTASRKVLEPFEG